MDQTLPRKQDFGYVCRHCGISSPTLRKWYRRYNAKGIEGLSDISKKPHNSSNKKLREQLIEKILILRNERNIGARRIQLELFIQDRDTAKSCQYPQSS